ncbi:MAG: CAP domain-containing protein [Fuerstiella sp.]
MSSTQTHRRMQRCGTASYWQPEVLEVRILLAAPNLTNHEQLLLELVNRARANPTAEASRLGIGLNQGLSGSPITATPKQPLAPHQALLSAARLHAQDMLDRNYVKHDALAPAPNGVTVQQRAEKAGYTGSVGENIGIEGHTAMIDQTQYVHTAHDKLFLSTTGHRQNILRDSYVEIGSGVRFGRFTDSSQNITVNATMVVEKFGRYSDGGVNFITGVVYSDATTGVANDDFYTIGEGAGGGTVTAVSTNTGARFSDDVGSSGGYSLQIPNDTYDVFLEHSGKRYVQRGVIVDDANQKVDFELTSATVDVPSVIRGNVDGDQDFDANDSFLIHLVSLSANNQQIEGAKGTSTRTGDQIRQAVTALGTAADVDGDGDFDANDSFLIHLVKLSGSDAQIIAARGSSVLSATQIRTRINALGTTTTSASSQASRNSLPTASQSLFDNKPADEEETRGTGLTQSAERVRAEQTSADSVWADSVWGEFRNWIDVL